ncbi:hypothetical protein AB833_16065 [Chromatiales bacterium (ex Bugula neritina AB1)]|nr:hypothetical protein AB833_16065 [Chromatiales bacterium (ex Bugula neritina AB1)]
MENITVALNQLSELVFQALASLGLDKQEQRAVHDVLMYAQTRGSSQGLIKIQERTVLPDADCRDIQILNRSGIIATVDGGGHTGMLVMQRATEHAIDLVKANGLTLVNTRNTRSSTGSIGFYARQFAENGNIGIVLAGSPKVMAVEGGIDPVLGTNPIAIAIPTGNAPLILDMATAATTWFAIINARNADQPLPERVALNNKGEPTTDASEALSGALKTFGGAKGSGLALMFELLTAPLASASIVGDDADNRGNTIIGIDPSIVLGDNSYQERVDLVLNRIRAGRRANSQIRLPGEYSESIAQHCKQTNSITLDRNLYNSILEIANSN